jgi:hypothetical protein
MAQENNNFSKDYYIERDIAINYNEFLEILARVAEIISPC